MKRKLQLFSLSLACILIPVSILAQTTSYDSDFSEGHPFENIYDWAEGQITASVVDGQLQVDYDKAEDKLWDRLVFWVNPFDIGGAPYCSFTIKGDHDHSMKLTFKDDTDAAIDKTFDITTEYQLITLDLSADMGSLGANKLLKELQWDVGYNNDSGRFWLDDFKMGLAADPGAQSGDPVGYYQEDFNAGTVPPAWKIAPGYTLSNPGDHLQVDIRKNTLENTFSYTLRPPHPLDLSDSALLSFDYQISEDQLIHFLIYDGAGNMVEGLHRLLASDDFCNVFIDFSGKSSVDYSDIRELRINVAKTNVDYSGRLLLDNFCIGSAVTPTSTILPLKEQVYFEGSKGVSLFVGDVYNASQITLENGGSLLQNISVADVDGRIASIEFDCVDEAVGSETLFLVSTALDGYENGRYPVQVTIESNQPPSMDALPDLELGVGEEVLVRMKGIKDNNISLDQEISVSVEAANAGLAEISSLDHVAGMANGTFLLKGLAAGQTGISISLDEGMENGTAQSSFILDVYDNFNRKPVIPDPGVQKLYSGNTADTIYLTGVHDGDSGEQVLSVSASSDKPGVVDVTGANISGDSIILELVSGNKGSALITVTLADDGGDGSNNGDQQAGLSFTLNVVGPPATGYVADFSNVAGAIQRGTWAFSGKYKASTVDSSANGYYAMKVEVTDKDYWNGSNLRFAPEGIEMDLSNDPYFSMEIYPLDDETLHWIWFYDYTETRNDVNNRNPDKIGRCPAGQWTEVKFDYSGDFDWRNGESGKDIDNSRIVRILFDMHNKDFAWPPPPNYTGAFLVRNLRIGSEVDQPPPPPVKPTLDAFSLPVTLENSGPHRVNLSGISDGAGSIEGLSIEVKSSLEEYVKIVEVDGIAADGTSGFSFESIKAGPSLVTVTISGGASEEDRVVNQWAKVITAHYPDAVQATVDHKNTFQTIRGFGAYYAPRYAEEYAGEMSATAMRCGLISNQIEWENDNNDPYVLNMEAFDQSAFDWDYLRRVKALGVESFILTSWSPPAWMKENLTTSLFAAGHSGDTEASLNRLSFHYYEEFAESMVAVVRMFKDNAGIDLAGIGLQNEPAFHEPYPSAILDPHYFKELVKVVGKRFEQEGIETMLYMPEQVFTQGYPSMMDYMDVLNADAGANAYAGAIASHSYATNGINAATPDWSQWTAMWNKAQEGAKPMEMWMTETHRAYTDHDDAMNIAAGIAGALIGGNASLWTQWSFPDQFLTANKPNSMLYAMKNYSGFVRPGAIRIASSSSNRSLVMTAFRHPESQAVSLVIVNLADGELPMDISAPNLPVLYDAYRTSANENCAFTGKVDISKMMVVPGRSVITLHAIDTSALRLNGIANMVVDQNAGLIEVVLTGIDNGAGSTAGLSIMAESSDENLITGLQTADIQTDGSCVLSFTPNPQADGFARITVTLTDGEELRKESFYVQVNYVEGLDELSATGLRIYPNPAGERLYVECPGGIRSLELVDVTGRMQLQVDGDERALIQLDLGGLQKGVYWLKANTTMGEQLIKSFVRQ